MEAVQKKYTGTSCLPAEIIVDTVSKTFPDGTRALSGITFTVSSGEFVVIGGSNGSGKTVLMSLIAGLDSPTEGTIDTAERTGLVFQDADAQILGETPLEDASFGPCNSGYSKKEAAERAQTALAQCGLGSKLYAPARLMSGGEKRRLAVAGIIALDCGIFIFDEPFANLDWPGVQQVCAILAELKKNGKTVIVLTHEIEKILALASRFIVLDKGAVCFDGTPAAGLEQDLAQWGIRNPLAFYHSVTDLYWGNKEDVCSAE
jgi:biotin transport system ATP-binding protein